MPTVATAGPAECDLAKGDGRNVLADRVNRRIIAVRFDAAACERCGVKWNNLGAR